MTEKTQPAQMKALALRSSSAALVMARGFEAFVFDLDAEGFVVEEDVYVTALALGFELAGVIAETPEGIEELCTTPSDEASATVMAWARRSFTERLGPKKECSELEALLQVGRTRAVTEMVNFLVRFYHMCEDTARELIAEGLDTTSLQSLADYRVARAVHTSTPPTDLAG